MAFQGEYYDVWGFAKIGRPYCVAISIGMPLYHGASSRVLC